MVYPQKTQPLSDFNTAPGETLDRITRTGDAEVLTENGRALAVLLSPEAFERLEADARETRDADRIRRSIAQHERGEHRDGFAALADLKQRLTDQNGA